MDKRLVTKREILFSIVIITVMLVFGFMISSGISNSLMNDYFELIKHIIENLEYYQNTYNLKFSAQSEQI